MKRGIFTVPLEAPVLGTVGGVGEGFPVLEVTVVEVDIASAAEEVPGEVECVAGIGEVEEVAGDVSGVVERV